MVNKRKRDDPSDSDDMAPGKQILPVANLPDDFDLEPEDGAQYLFLVRRDARRLPHTTRVRNPYEMSEVNTTHALSPQPSTDVLPCEEWRTAFQSHFRNLRKNLTQATIHVHFNPPGARQLIIPEKKDRDAWWKFLTGHPESAWSPKHRSSRKKPSTLRRMRGFPDTADVGLHESAAIPSAVQSTQEGRSDLQFGSFVDAVQNPPSMSVFSDHSQSPASTSTAPFTVNPPILPAGVRDQQHGIQLTLPEVTPTYLREIDHRMSLHLLMYFTHWINVHLENPSDPSTTISSSHGRWMFAFLTKVEDQLSADEMNLLRNLARACLGLIKHYRPKPEESAVVAEGAWSTSDTVGKETRVSDASCWMVFTAVAGHWGQRDLWTDAETALANA
ncbi:hypothetical protein BDN67DRAFT_947119 [Paxillus ammoniavirescens]|nr:hypothetical protein BDN67DRAFT_947119 [Paxillus ammoniavirescens]